jgi:hypothetical protein
MLGMTRRPIGPISGLCQHKFLVISVDINQLSTSPASCVAFAGIIKGSQGRKGHPDILVNKCVMPM